MKQGFFYVLLASLFGAFMATLAGHAEIQRMLRKGTDKALAADPSTAALLGHMKIEFRGQEAFVTGHAGSRDELARLETGLLEAKIPARFGRVMSAVTRVHLDGVRVADDIPQ